MKKRFAALVLIAALLLSLCSCSEVMGEIAGNVADAALKELELQIKETLQEYKVEIVEIKSAVGQLNDASDSTLQFFCGVLVRSNSDALPNSGANALDKLFEKSGIQKQTGSKIENELLQNKSISFKHTDYSADNYYLIWVYTSSLTQNLSELELPTLPEGWLPKDGARTEGVG